MSGENDEEVLDLGPPGLRPSQHGVGSGATASQAQVDPLVADDPWKEMTPRRSPPQKTPGAGERIRGFSCNPKTTTLEECKQQTIVCRKLPIKQKASEFLECPISNISVYSYKGVDLAMAYENLVGVRKPVNFIASRLNYAFNQTKHPVYGDALFFTCDDEGNNKNPNMKGKLAAWEGFQHALEKAAAEVGDWPNLTPESQEMTPGFLVFISVEGKVEQVPVENVGSLGFEAVVTKINATFLEKGSKKQSMSCKDSDDDEDKKDEERTGAGASSKPTGSEIKGLQKRPTKKMFQHFQDYGLKNSFFEHVAKDINIVSVAGLLPDEKLHVNKAAAYFLGRTYGSSLNTMVKHLWGDVILWTPGNHWKPDDAFVRKFVFDFDEVCTKADAEIANAEIANAGKLELSSGEIDDEIRQQEMKLIMRRYTDFEGGKDAWKRRFDQLEGMARIEDWNHRVLSVDKEDSDNNGAAPYLDNYVRYMFAHSINYQAKHPSQPACGVMLIPGDKIGSNSTLVFATGLFNSLHQPIYGKFERKDPFGNEGAGIPVPKKSDRFVFKEWTKDRGSHDPLDPIDLLSDVCIEEGCAKVNLQLHELKSFNPYATLDIESNLQHIIGKGDRFEKDNENQHCSDHNGWRSNMEKLAQQFRQQVDLAIMMCRSDRTMAIITCFGDGHYQWLLPLPNPMQAGLGTPSLTVVLRPVRHG
eukprot:CAMPEP_0115123072 /NCGR_PEP_ID=MMETSP0227-20121206/47245_1 /TAXON_ID=89957 /ORGANISM="Polarella glacialis, Strain CCMP 1383" /LENGTH=698 /DNA_ID=CAMNT_0002525215 /DNA_START=107 /DNA_END=2200 /DNA_ORIENTATION=+